MSDRRKLNRRQVLLAVGVLMFLVSAWHYVATGGGVAKMIHSVESMSEKQKKNEQIVKDAERSDALLLEKYKDRLKGNTDSTKNLIHAQNSFESDLDSVKQAKKSLSRMIAHPKSIRMSLIKEVKAMESDRPGAVFD
ncbi:MAG: hypothetical protein AAF623_05410 [Planctomycetota bacterium]